MNKPTISVIMPNYNYGHYIGEALDAVFSQSFPAKEVIVVDDASTDDSISIIEGYAKKYPTLKLIRNPRNIGVVNTVNKGVAFCSSDYMISAASDDKILPGFFEKSMDVLIKYPQAGLSFSDMELFIEDKRIMIYHKFYLRDSASYFSPDELAELLSHKINTFIFSPTVIVKRSAFVEAGNYLPQLKWGSDAFMQHTVGFRYGVCYVPEILSMHRFHSKQYSAGQYDMEQKREVIHKTFDALLLPEYHDVLQRFRRSAVFFFPPWDVLNEALREKKYRGFLSYDLYQKAFYDNFIRQPLLSILPRRWLKEAANSIKRIKLLLKKRDENER